ncbi:spore protease YyaC [Desulfolucanica intricata]|uniref:spore protease YyaC n=1 Tax=Desulfolucanica intricata TaxID=1285191 RepID=UPI0008311B19|nr:spore protease YyaC [Desulfolucanica intricata]
MGPETVNKISNKHVISIYYQDKLAVHRLSEVFKELLPLNQRPISFICIGTDRSTGDSFGPLTGTFLQQAGLKNVHGSLNKPVHACNLDYYLNKIPKSHFIVGLDAALGKNVDSIGMINVKNSMLYPGRGVNKQLTPVGELAVTFTVNAGSGFMEYLVLQSTRLNIVWEGAKVVAKAILSAT